MNAFKIMMLVIIITILGIINDPVFHFKHDVSETGFCLRLQVEPTQFGPIEKARLGGTE
jgi:hypothetical protein